jgi:ATP-dependent Lhr-like helicase
MRHVPHLASLSASRQTPYVQAVTRTLPEPFAAWFATRGWTPRPHQLDALDASRDGDSVLLIAPTGGGKTLAGFLPSLIELAAAPHDGLHTLYVSPLKALAADIARNLTIPVQEMGLQIDIDTRTGDTSSERRRKQKEAPPNLLLTTPESLAVLVAQPESAVFFAALRAVVIDEVHALAGTKRGDQLALCLTRLSALAPGLRRIGLSATVAHPQALIDYVSHDGRGGGVRVVETRGGAPPEITMILPKGHLPWAGHMGIFSAPAILEHIRGAGMTIVFVNTRAQAELIFQALWKINDETLPIAIHHGSLELESRKKVERAMADGVLRAVVATSSLDLGIDWGGVDQVLQVGAPKGVSRLLQRVGRANHRMEEASRAVLVPANRFEVLECEAAILGVAAHELDGDPPPPGGFDVLAQHILGVACAGPILPDDLYREVTTAAPYAGLSRADFDAVVGFVEDGGYALAAYERYRKLFRDSDGRLHVMNTSVARQHRMNIGTIVEMPLVKVRYMGRGGGNIGEVEEYFINTLSPGDTFMFAGRLLKFVRLRETVAEVVDGGTGVPKVPAYAGGRMPMTTNLAARVRGMLSDPGSWHAYPEPVQEWLALQKKRSRLPGRDDLLVETFPRGDRWFLVAYCFEGRNAHQTLGMLLTRRMERFGMAPLGFVATDYVLAVWSVRQPQGVARLFEQDMLGDDLEAWMAESSMLRRTFRNVAVIAGLIERHHPGAEKSKRQVTVNSDLIYDVLRRHQPDHILLRATRADAAGGLTELGRISLMLERAHNKVRHVVLSRVSPLAVPVLLEVGRESVRNSESDDALLADAEDALIAEAMGEAEPPPFEPMQLPTTRLRQQSFRPGGRPGSRQGRLFG